MTGKKATDLDQLLYAMKCLDHALSKFRAFFTNVLFDLRIKLAKIVDYWSDSSKYTGEN